MNRFFKKFDIGQWNRGPIGIHAGKDMIADLNRRNHRARGNLEWRKEVGSNDGRNDQGENDGLDPFTQGFVLDPTVEAEITLSRPQKLLLPGHDFIRTFQLVHTLDECFRGIKIDIYHRA